MMMSMMILLFFGAEVKNNWDNINTDVKCFTYDNEMIKKYREGIRWERGDK